MLCQYKIKQQAVQCIYHISSFSHVAASFLSFLFPSEQEFGGGSRQADPNWGTEFADE